MKGKHLYKLSLMILMIISFNSNAQVLTEIQSKFNHYKQTAVEEKIFVHTDKNFYMAGEIMWFKIYCVDGTYHKPLNLSKVVYVDVLDNSQTPVIQAKVAMKNGIGDVSVYIPVNVNSGNYKFRAYTNWMKNFSPDYYFEKNVTIVNSLKSPDMPPVAAANYDVQFFPEGGNLVNGIASKVAFKVVGRDGKGVAFKGAIIDRLNDTIARFQPLKFGMGNFTFTPASNNNYKAVIKVGNNKAVIKDLPSVNNQGYVIQLKDNESEQLDISVKAANVPDGTIYLFVHTRQNLKIAESVTITSGAAHFTIHKNKLDEGISHITLFNSDRQPVCERLYFKRPKHQLFIEAGTDQSQYSSRKKVTVTIAAKDLSGKSSPADLSMSVYRLDTLQAVKQGDIFSYLWLSSELKGNIESSEYYFSNDADGTNEAVDNLMLSQGWRKFQWSNVLTAKQPGFNFIPEYEGHLITGKITNSTTHAPVADVFTYMGIPGKRIQLYTSKSDANGNLIFNTRDLYGANELVIQAKDRKDSTYRIDINTPFSEQFSSSSLPLFQLNKSAEQLLRSYSLNVQAQNIYAGSQIKKLYPPVIDSGAFYGKQYPTYMLDNYTRFTTMEEVLREYVRGLYVTKTKTSYKINLYNSSFFDKEDPLVIIDGVPIFDMNKVIALDPLKIKKLEVVSDIYYYGPTVNMGIFSFSTYKGDLGGYEIDPHAVVLDYDGLELQREFYSPVYETDKQANSTIPDFRNLLFWEPNIITDTTAKKQVSFYTSDQTGKYIGLLQGITSDGKAASQSFEFEVK